MTVTTLLLTILLVSVIAGAILFAVRLAFTSMFQCPFCKGTGELPPNGNETGHTTCTICKGKGKL